MPRRTPLSDRSERRSNVLDFQQYGGRLHLVPETRMKMLATVADTADSRAGNDGHCWRVAAYVAELVRVLGLAPYQSALFVDAARLHDIGAVDMPAEVLTKPNPLSEQDWSLIRTHVARGSERLRQLPETSPLCNVVLRHHERVDGTGYPDRLSVEAIPLGARVIAVADSFDAMTHAHDYKPADFIAQSLETLERGAGSAWDREIVLAFVTEAVPHLMRTGTLMVSHDGQFDRSLGRISGRARPFVYPTGLETCANQVFRLTKWISTIGRARVRIAPA